MTQPWPRDGEKIWVLVSETPSDTCDKMSLVGLYSSREHALAYLERWGEGKEIAAAIMWTQLNPDMWEGHDEDHEHCYLLTAEGALEHGLGPDYD